MCPCVPAHGARSISSCALVSRRRLRLHPLLERDLLKLDWCVRARTVASNLCTVTRDLSVPSPPPARHDLAGPGRESMKLSRHCQAACLIRPGKPTGSEWVSRPVDNQAYDGAGASACSVCKAGAYSSFTGAVTAVSGRRDKNHSHITVMINSFE
jgi:hypothetical protein